MSIALVTDSTAYLPDDLVRAHDLSIVPLHVVIRGEAREEGVAAGADEVAAVLRAGGAVSTSRPTPQAFVDTYARCAQAGASAIVSVHISSDLSATVDGARLAASQAPGPVTVIDSRVMGMAMGYAVVSGAEAAAGGASADEVATAVRARCAAASVVFYVDTLEFLRRGGRIGAASALVGSALSIKPILGIDDGRIVPLEKVRTASKAIARVEDLAVAATHALPSTADGVDVAVHHLDNAERAEALGERLRARAGDLRDLRVLSLGAVIGAHVGPGTLAVVVSPRVGTGSR